MRVLAIDGGGIRGLIPAVVLADVERRTGRRSAELFDLIAGTSTGGILAAALSCPGEDGGPRYAAEELIDLYTTQGPMIFDPSLLRTITTAGGLADERYDADGLEAALAQYLGDTRLSQTVVPVLLTAYDIEARRAFFFRTERARADPAYDFALAHAAHATSAAPTYFEPVQVTDAADAHTYPLIDGGVFATNPAMCAWTDLVRDRRAPDMSVLASLGTGTATRPIEYERARGWGVIGWARPLIDVLFSGAAETVDFQLGQLLSDRYVRIQGRLEGASDDLDDASPENLRNLRALGERFVRENEATIDALCAQLTADD